MATIYTDVFGSVARRAKQEEKDAAELAAPVLAMRLTPGFQPSTVGRYNLRPIDERVINATPSEKTRGEILIRRARKQLAKGLINKAQLRRFIAQVGRASSFFDVVAPAVST